MKALFRIIVGSTLAATLFATPTIAAPKGLSETDWSGIRGAYEKSRHAIISNPDGSHQARNPGQAWLTKFDGRGFTVTPDSGGWAWGLELAGFGEASEVRQDGGKISYVRADGLTEWFINDTRGLEQGWTLSKRPEQAGSSGPIRLNLAVRGDLRPQVAAEGASVAFVNETGGAALTYGGLKAWDADGKTVDVRFVNGEVGEIGLGVVVDDAGAKYPITVDPIAQQARLTGSQMNIDFGQAVAVSDDTVVVGAPRENKLVPRTGQSAYLSTEAGGVYIFGRNGPTWEQQAHLQPSGNVYTNYHHCGTSVAISGDTVVMGAPGQFSQLGQAWVYVRNGTTWTLQAGLTASNLQAEDYFGDSVAISGNTIVIGAPREDSNATGVNGNQSNDLATESGAAYVFTREGNTWAQQAYLKAANTESGDGFGESVAVLGDTLVVGAPGEDSAATGVNVFQNDNSASTAGAAYVFVRGALNWSQQAYLKASNTGAGDAFGFAVALSGDTVAVGAWGEASNATGVNGDQADNSAQASGACYVFVRTGNGWSQQAYLKASNTEADDWFGQSVAVAGNTVVVGAPGEDNSTIGTDGNQADNSAPYAGAAYLFERTSTDWNHVAYLKGSNVGQNCRFGTSVAVSGDTTVAGSPFDMWTSGQSQGGAYVFTRSYTLTVTAAHGTTEGSGDYEGNSMAQATVSASPGYLFTGWTGDATGTANPLSVLMDADKAITATFGPDTNDPDEDGLTNYQEIVEKGTNPTLPDSDGDNVKDGNDAFPLDINEWLDTDGDGTGDNADTDDDGDGLSDEDEINIHGTNPKRADSDGDGLSDPAELQTHLTNPNLADTDNDGLNDGAEVNTHGTLPKVADTDGDGFLDGYEVLTGKSPLNILDKPALVAEARTAVEFTFPSAVGKTYRIEDSFDLTTWGTVESSIAGNGAVIQRFYSTRNMPKRYFRVEEDAP